MIANPITYSQQEKSVIETLVGANDFCASSWEDELLKTIKSRVKLHYIIEQNYLCCYCKQPNNSVHGRVWDLEHIIARSVRCDFMFEPCNLAAACVECNNEKGTVAVSPPSLKKFPRQPAQYFLVHPHFDNWDEHIELEGEYTYHALSKKGSFTIYHCDLFRFRQRMAGIRRPIRDRRFERDIEELRFARSVKEARPIISSILSRIEIEDET